MRERERERERDERERERERERTANKATRLRNCSLIQYYHNLVVIADR